MTPEQQRTAIAEACGIVSEDRWGKLYHTPKGYVRNIPDYLNDLNAMHEAEGVLCSAQRERYRTELVYMHAGEDVFSTAAQRAEAFLKTLNIWKE